MKTKKRNTKNQSGITLVALVVTIIILIILATISIRMVIGEGGLIDQANKGKVEYRAAEVDEEVLAWKAEKKMAEYATGTTPQKRNELITDQLKRGLLTQEEADTATKTGEVTIGSRTINYGDDDTPTESPEKKSEIQEAKESQQTFDTSTPLTDEHGNTVVIPGKFHIAEDSGETVEQGIVIEDSDGNQFVWIPVSNIDGDNKAEEGEENLIKKDDGSTVEITLGRYTFAESSEDNPGEPTLVQKGSQYESEEKLIDSYDYYEKKDFREASTSNSSTAVNAAAKNLGEFISSVQKNHGYYIGRYEASYGSGSEFGAVTEEVTKPDVSWYKPLVQPSTANSTSSWNPDSSKETGEVGAPGTLWNFITQGNASKVCRNMYNENDEENNYVESDLVNSYMWDTAIVYIQEMGNSNYANKKPLSANLTNTGTLSDQKCKIYDMAGNVCEWTTEYSASTHNNTASPCVVRGGGCNNSSSYTVYRYGFFVTTIYYDCSGFRPALYIKSTPEG